MHDVKLEVDGMEYGGFVSGRVKLGLEQIASDFELVCVDTWQQNAQPVPIEEGDRCAIKIDGAVLIEGWVDRVTRDYSAERRSISVVGRSLACDLVDCSAMNVPSSWRKAPLGVIVKDLVAPFSIATRILGEEGEDFERFKLTKGEKVADAIVRAARMRGMLVYSVGRELLLGNAGATTSETVIRLGDQVIRGTRESAVDGRYRDYHFRAQRRASDDVHGDAAAQLRDVVRDEGITRHRPLLVLPTGAAGASDLRTRATIERNQRAGRGERLSYTVAGWTCAEGLWSPNVRVKVVDDWLDVDAQMLVVGVQLEIDGATGGGGYVTKLELTRPEAYAIEDYPVRPRRGGIR